MALYLVIHTPKQTDDEAAQPPTRLREVALHHSGEHASPRWLRAWSPDLHDDRIFTLWEAINAAEILATMEAYGFLDHMDAQPLQVREWGPHDVLAAAGDQ